MLRSAPGRASGILKRVWIPTTKIFSKGRRGLTATYFPVIAAVAVRTRGRAISRVGKAITHESAHARSHRPRVPAVQPALTSVLTRDTTKVIRSESIKGVNQVPALGENLGRSRRVDRVMEVRNVR